LLIREAPPPRAKPDLVVSARFGNKTLIIMNDFEGFCKHLLFQI